MLRFVAVLCTFHLLLARRDGTRVASSLGFEPGVKEAITAFAKREGWEPAALAAVVEVESAGQVWTYINGQRLPKILYEFHSFYNQLENAGKMSALNRAKRERLAFEDWSLSRYPPTQFEQYDLLRRAALIDQEAAYASCSWGLGQVMGFHAGAFGFKSSTDIALHAIASVEGQLDLMVRFIKMHRIGDHIAHKRFVEFAAVYNGHGKKADYGAKIEAAYQRWKGATFSSGSASTTVDVSSAKLPVLGDAKPLLDIGTARMEYGDEGYRVAAMQRLLAAVGFDVLVDGHFGGSSRYTLRRVQEKEGLAATGRWDTATRKAVIAMYRAETGDTTPVRGTGLTNEKPSASVSIDKDGGAEEESGVMGSLWGSFKQSLRSWRRSGDSGAASDELLLDKLGSRPIREGSAGDRVRALQQALKDIGYDVGVVDGDYGQATVAAVEKFQASRNFRVNGSIDMVTLLELKEAWVLAMGLAPSPKPSSGGGSPSPPPAGVSAKPSGDGGALSNRLGEGGVSATSGEDRVSAMQEVLKGLGYDVSVDGDYGPGTKKAVSAFQAAQGLDVDGAAGPETVGALRAAWNEYLAVQSSRGSVRPRPRPGSEPVGGSTAGVVVYGKEDPVDSVKGGTKNAKGAFVADGMYGQLAMRPDGTYSYALDTSLATVRAKGRTEGALVDTFTLVRSAGKLFGSDDVPFKVNVWELFAKA